MGAEGVRSNASIHLCMTTNRAVPGKYQSKTPESGVKRIPRHNAGYHETSPQKHWGIVHHTESILQACFRIVKSISEIFCTICPDGAGKKPD